MDVLVACAELSAVNLIALNSTVKLAVEYKVNIEVCAEKLMTIQILHYLHSPMYLQAEEVTILFYVLCYTCKVMGAVIKLTPLAQHPL